MARDVEFNVTASDKSGNALAAAEAKFKATQERMRREEKKTGDGLGDSLTRGIGKAAPGILGKLQGVFTQGGVSGGQLLAVGVAAAAPFIGAALSGAIIGGAGVGGVLGGVYLVSNDPRVSAAGKQLAANLMRDLRDDATPFVEPVLSAIGKVEQRWDLMRGRVRKILSDSSAFVDPLVDGALNGIDGILRGVESLTRRGKPTIDAFGRSFDIVGDSIGDALEIVSGGSEDAATAVEDLAHGVGAAIVVAGGLVRALTEVYGVVSFIPGKISDLSDRIGRWAGITDEAKESSDGLSEGLRLAKQQWENNQEATDRVNQALADSQKLMDEAAQAVRDLTSANQALYGSETQVGEATDRATESRKKNGRTLDANTEKGRANREALLGVATAAQRQYEAFVKVNGEGPRSAALAQRLRGDFIRLATAFTGSKQKAEQLANQILGIPKTHKTDIKVQSNAVQASKAAKAAINSVHSKTVNVTVTVNTSRLAAVENRLSRLHGVGIGASAGSYWAAVDSTGATARTGGATPVNVSNSIAVSLDGAPFYDMTVSAVQASNRRQAWRAKVGAR